MFDRQPKNLTAAAGIAILSGLISFALAFALFDEHNDKILVTIGSLLLIAVVFLAIGGALFSNGQWSWGTTMFAAFLCPLIAVVACIYGALTYEVTAVLLVLSVLTIALVAPKTSENVLK